MGVRRVVRVRRVGTEGARRTSTECRTLVRVTFALLSMSVLTFLLDVCGIYIFIALESDNQLSQCREKHEDNRKKIDQLLEVTKFDLKNRIHIENETNHEIDEIFVNLTFKLEQLHENEECREWTFMSTLTLVTAIKTTIGWGNVAPVTVNGRLFLMFYALVTIPWFGFLVVFLGHLQMRALWWMHERRVKLVVRIKLWYRWKTNRIGVVEYARSISALNKPTKPSDPPLWSIILALGYGVGIGTAAYVYYDKLDPFESFYFSFINFTTIGFGDIVPQHKSFTDYMIISSAITYNMSILTICFSIVQNKFREKLNQLKAMMSPNPPMEEDELEDEEEAEQGRTLNQLLLQQQSQKQQQQRGEMSDQITDETSVMKVPLEWTLPKTDSPNATRRRVTISNEEQLMDGGTPEMNGGNHEMNVDTHEMNKIPTENGNSIELQEFITLASQNEDVNLPETEREVFL